MGASNAMSAFLRWGHLDDRPHRALVFMALVSMDSDARPRYWGGWEAIARTAFGRDVQAEPHPGDRSAAAEQARRDRRAARVSVDEACRVLKRANAITTVRRGGYRHQAEYELNLSIGGGLVQADPASVQVPQMQGEPASQMQGEPASQMQGEPASQMQGEPASEEDRGGLRNTGGTTSPQVGNSPAPRRPSSGEVRLIDGGLRALVDLHRAGVGS